jgi:uncharacterized protein YndB with AHSA1/START domain
MNKKEVSVRTEGKSLFLEREFSAPRELVFEAYSDCKHLKRWWGPKAWPLTYCQLDFQPGGKWHYCLSEEGGDGESWGLATYKEIAKPEHIIYIDQFADKDGNVNEEMPSQHVTVTLIETEGGTKLRSRTDYESEEALQQILEMGVVEGISSTWNRLAEFLAKQTA